MTTPNDHIPRSAVLEAIDEISAALCIQSYIQPIRHRIAAIPAAPVDSTPRARPVIDPVFTITPCGHDVRVEIHQTAALLARILGHPRVRAYCEGRGWRSNRIVCPKCKERSTVMTTWDTKVVWCRECDGQTGHGKRVPRSHFPEKPCYTGPDLALDSNLNELLGLADSLSHHMLDLTADQGVFYATIYTETPMETVEIWRGEGPTRTLAVLAALGRALGIEVDA